MRFNNISEEVINGYFVTLNRKKLWKIELEMLQIFDKACRELGLNYFAIFGTAIGAARHKGFIPWDDDIDIGMVREDFDKLLNHIGEFLSDDYECQYGYRKPGFDFLLRIRDKRTTGVTFEDLNRCGCKGVFLEVYPFDDVDLNILRTIQIKICLKVYKLMDLKRYQINECRGLRLIKRLFCCVIPSSITWSFYQALCRLQNDKNAEYVDCIAIPNYSKDGNCLIRKEYIEKTIDVPFEYTTIRLPIKYDEILRNNYGDYMKMPPIEERGKHHTNTVFYDPNKPYTDYENSSRLIDYFSNPSLKDEI